MPTMNALLDISASLVIAVLYHSNSALYVNKSKIARAVHANEAPTTFFFFFVLISTISVALGAKTKKTGNRMEKCHSQAHKSSISSASRTTTTIVIALVLRTYQTDRLRD